MSDSQASLVSRASSRASANTQTEAPANSHPPPADHKMPVNGRVVTTHSVVSCKVLRASPRCPSFRKGDVFYVRQHMLDTDVSAIRNFCYHSLTDLYAVYGRVRKGPVGSREIMDCRDKAMVQFEVERLADETAEIGRSSVKDPQPLPCHSGTAQIEGTTP